MTISDLPNTTSKTLAVEVRDTSVVYQTADHPVHALSDIDLNIAQGEFVSLIGPSGCGKTTLMRVIADLEQISAGQVLVNGVSPRDARLARAYGYVFQAPALFPWRTVLANVTLPSKPLRLTRARCSMEISRALSFECPMICKGKVTFASTVRQGNSAGA